MRSLATAPVPWRSLKNPRKSRICFLRSQNLAGAMVPRLLGPSSVCARARSDSMRPLAISMMLPRSTTLTFGLTPESPEAMYLQRVTALWPRGPVWSLFLLTPGYPPPARGR
jgi:hypothetical protein